MKKKLLFLLDNVEEIVLVPGFALMLLIGFGNELSRFVLHQSWSLRFCPKRQTRIQGGNLKSLPAHCVHLAWSLKKAEETIFS